MEHFPIFFSYTSHSQYFPQETQNPSKYQLFTKQRKREKGEREFLNFYYASGISFGASLY